MNPRSLWDRLVGVAHDEPGRPALRAAGDVRLTYGEVVATATNLARSIDTPPRTGVGVVAPSGSVLEATAAWASWATGAAFVPLSPSDPVRRLSQRLARLPMSVVVVDDRSLGRVEEACRLVGLRREVHQVDGTTWVRLPPCGVLPPDVVALSSTSGSTGRPRSVALTRAGLTNVAEWSIGLQGMSSRSRIMGVYPATFDAFLQVLLAAHLSGACLVAPPPALGLSGARLIDRLRTERITHLDVTPSVMALVGESVSTSTPPDLPDLEAVVLGGEQVTWRAVRTVRRLAPSSRVFNMYGPAESTVTALAYEVPHGEMPLSGAVPIGVPVPGNQAHIRRDGGEAGELILSGVGVAPGYLVGASREDASIDPFPPTGYCTGDIVREVDGHLIFVGRRDRQLSLRGVRVEAGEIEHAALGVPGVADAFACVVTGGGAERLALAYVDCAQGHVAEAQVRSAISAVLPPELVPHHIVRYTGFPRSPHGKRDERLLSHQLTRR